MKKLEEASKKKVEEANKKVEEAEKNLKNANKNVELSKKQASDAALKLQQDDELHKKNQKTLKYMNNAKDLSRELFKDTNI